jgi:predicted enzyme related to lactoylglutathione lyase
VTDLDATVRRLVELGSDRLGPTVHVRDGTSYATLRDPEGAVVSVRESTESTRAGRIAWHQLHTKDAERSWAVYAELFGWEHTETREAADVDGGHRLFTWGDSGASVGSIANTARWPGVHAHWMFYFPVGDLEAALAKVRARGGRVIAPPAVLTNGVRLAPCEDGQEAAFGLLGQ